MGDIDFDELDKAVNSLMSTSNSTGSNNAPSPAPPPAPATPGQTPVVAPSESPVAVAPVSAPPPPPQASRGRFMDVMPPSTQTSVAPSNPVPPQSAPLTPNESQNDTVQPVAESAPQTQLQPSEQQTLSSPFLPNAQVEKRPLGGAAVPATGEVPSSVNEQTTVAPASAPSMPKLEDAFGNQESTTMETAGLNGEKKPIDQTIDSQRALDPTSFDKKPTSQDVELAKLESHEVAETPPPAKNVAEEPSLTAIESGDTEHLKTGNAPQEATNATKEAPVAESHGIYDEHQSLNHPAKQKSGHWVVIAIILVIIVFISLGIAAFFILGPGI